MNLPAHYPALGTKVDATLDPPVINGVGDAVTRWTVVDYVEEDGVQGVVIEARYCISDLDVVMNGPGLPEYATERRTLDIGPNTLAAFKD
jgi:hypothetical protein